jgi:hypothetical protein
MSRVCVLSDAVNLRSSGAETPCPVHGELSVGDPGLAHQLLGHLELTSIEESSMDLEAAVSGGGSDCFGRSLAICLLEVSRDGLMRHCYYL